MNTGIVNPAAIERQLSGATVALDKCIRKINSGVLDDEAPLVIAVDFEQVLYHLCLAWHFRFRTEEELARRTQEEYVKLSNCVPNFNFNLTLLVGIDREDDIPERKLNRKTVALELGEAKLALEAALDKTLSGAYENEAPVVMAIDFQKVLHHLCLAWHFKGMTDEQRDRLSHEDVERLGNTIPNFGFQLQLMSGIDPEVVTDASGNL